MTLYKLAFTLARYLVIDRARPSGSTSYRYPSRQRPLQGSIRPGERPTMLRRLRGKRARYRERKEVT